MMCTGRGGYFQMMEQSSCPLRKLTVLLGSQCRVQIACQSSWGYREKMKKVLAVRHR